MEAQVGEHVMSHLWLFLVLFRVSEAVFLEEKIVASDVMHLKLLYTSSSKGQYRDFLGSDCVFQLGQQPRQGPDRDRSQLEHFKALGQRREAMKSCDRQQIKS
jgi:hypothetical protein